MISTTANAGKIRSTLFTRYSKIEVLAIILLKIKYPLIIKNPFTPINENKKVLLVNTNSGSVAPAPFNTYEWETITNQANKMRNKSKLFA